MEDVVELVYLSYPLSVIQGLVHCLPCSRVAQIGRKTVRMWISLCKNRIVPDYEKDHRQKPRHRGREAYRHPSRGSRESGNRCGSSVGKSTSVSFRPSRRRRGGRMRRVRPARSFLEKFDPQCGS